MMRAWGEYTFSENFKLAGSFEHASLPHGADANYYYFAPAATR